MNGRSWMAIMVIASHVIFSAYGFWLPNDPRGSWSEFVGSWELFRFGRAAKWNDTRSQAAEPHDHAVRLAAKKVLKHPPVQFSGIQARAVGRGFARLVARSGVQVLACSILPEHVHMVIQRHEYGVEQIVNLLKGDATRQLVQEGLHPFQGLVSAKERPPTPWARGEWKVFIDREVEVEHAIEYVEQNPIKEGKPPQRWPFVLPARGVL